MDIKDILNGLGLDFSSAETKRGAVEAIEAILASRTPLSDNNMAGGGMPTGAGDETEVELDPDLIQPSIKQAPSGLDNNDIDVEDEENILDQIKHNEPEEPIKNTNSAGDDDPKSDKKSSTEDTTATNDSDSNSVEQDTSSNDSAELQDNSTNTDDSNELEGTLDDAESSTDDITSDDVEDSQEAPATEDSNDSQDASSADSEEDTYDYSDTDADADMIDSTETSDNEYDSEDANEAEQDDEFEFDEDDLIDDELKGSAEDEVIKAKHEARRIKRERTLAAAKKALFDAQAKKVAPALVRELENAIVALEALTEAVTKSIKDISDEEFNQLVNRVFDAIEACGDSGLTFTSDDEREARVKEIKNDIASATTQAELSAEDAAKIRAETQAIKARDKEADKYKRKAAGSFKGFQEFLNSLYRAIALQVHTEETRDDSWSAISRRNSGAGVLRQGQKVTDLPNKKIPVIDFYFDQSGSWTANDIKVGEKAVQSLADMEADGKIKINVYYFADSVHTDAESARQESGTGAWNEIVKNIISTQATNVIIMTDDDMERWWRPRGSQALSYTIPGYVWYLWKNGENAPRLPRDLKGRGGVQQFSFSANDV